MSFGAIRAAKRDAKRREERGLGGVGGDDGKVSSTRHRNLRAEERILVLPRVRHEVAEASERKHAHGNAVRGALTEAQGEERVHHADANERGLIRDATRRLRRRVSRRQLSRDGVVGFAAFPRRFHHPAHFAVGHEEGDEFERAEKIGGFLRRERGSASRRRGNLGRDDIREFVEERTLAEEGLIGGRTAEEVVAQLEAVLHDDASVRGALLADDVEAPFERALERDELSQIFAAAGERDEQQERLVANHLALQHHVHQSPHAHRVTHDGLAQVMRVGGAQRGEKLHGVISHVKIALVEEREDELDVRGDARERLRVGGAGAGAVLGGIRTVDAFVPGGSLLRPGRDGVGQHLEDEMDQLGVVPLLAKGLHEGRDADGADRELRGAGFQDEVAELGGGGTTVRGEYTVADALEEGLRGGGKMGGRARDSSACFLRGEGAVVGREPRGSEGARSRGSGGGNGGGSGRVPQRRRRRTRRRTRRCRRRRCGRRCPRRLPRPAGAGSGEAISVRQIRGRGGYGARARCVARGRGEGGEGEVRARTLATFPNIADISVAAPRRARCVLWFTAESDAQRLPVNNARIDRGAPQFADLPSGGFRPPPRIRHVLTRPQAAVLRRDEVLVARATCTPATSTARARIRRR